MADDVATFDDLCARLAGEPLSGKGTDALAVRKPEGFFVKPQFDVIQRPEGAGVVLLSARGAAGKSTTADALSELLGAPVWRLQDETTASSALVSWTLAKHLSMDWMAELPEMDRPLLIIDSLDEARARVSASSWSEFVDALIQAVKTGLRLVLLGRTLTLEDVGAQFEGDDLDVAWYEVSHFDADAQVEYVDGRIGAASKGSIDVTQATYRAARDAVLAALREPLTGGGDDIADKFVGYPPVLEAVVALLLDKRNHQAVANEFQSSTPSSRAAVLYKILEEITEREQGKLGGVARNLGLVPVNVYTPQEQAAWLLNALEGSAQPDLGYMADEEQRTRYIEDSAEFRDSHPFRDEGKWASPVFQAYVLTLTFHQAPTSALLAAGEASGMLFELMSVANTEKVAVDETQFAALHASLLSGQRYAADAAVSISQEEESIPGGAFSLGDTRSESATMDFILEQATSDVIVLHGPLTNLTVDVDCNVRVPARRDDVVLGPDLSISARSIVIEGTSTAFGRRDGGEEGNEVFLGVSKKITLPPTITPPPPRVSTLEIECPAALAYPWTEYARTVTQEPLPDVDARVPRFLDRLMDLTRAHGHSGPRGAFFHKLKGRQALKGENLRAALEVLKAKGVISAVTGDMIFISEDWEKYRYYSKTNGGLAGSTHLDVWQPILEAITGVLS